MKEEKQKMMKNILLALLTIVSMCGPVAAQQDRNERKEALKEAQEEKKTKNNNRVDYNVFRRQILTLPEYAEQRNKLQDIRKAGKGIPKIYAVVDSLNENDDPKKLIGYILLTLGESSANVYEITYDRTSKKIVQVKPTGETLDVEKEEATEPNHQEKGKKPATKKKKSEEDDEEEDEEEKPTKGKKKEPKDEDE